MKDLLICVLALTWVLVVIRQMGTRRYPRETADHIDRDFREMVDRYVPGKGRLGAMCPIHGYLPCACRAARDRRINASLGRLD